MGLINQFSEKIPKVLSLSPPFRKLMQKKTVQQVRQASPGVREKQERILQDSNKSQFRHQT